jgi:hypothetical protein
MSLLGDAVLLTEAFGSGAVSVWASHHPSPAIADNNNAAYAMGYHQCAADYQLRLEQTEARLAQAQRELHKTRRIANHRQILNTFVDRLKHALKPYEFQRLEDDILRELQTVPMTALGVNEVRMNAIQLKRRLREAYDALEQYKQAVDGSRAP